MRRGSRQVETSSGGSARTSNLEPDGYEPSEHALRRAACRCVVVLFSQINIALAVVPRIVEFRGATSKRREYVAPPLPLIGTGMARRVLTDRTLRALRPAPAGQRLDIMDAVVPGFGVRVTDKADERGRAAQRTFVLVARYPGSANPTRRALGNFGVLSLEQARVKARDWLELIHRGVDPRDEEGHKRRAEIDRRANTFGAITEDFIKRHLSRQRRGRTGEREIRRELLSRWKDKPAGEITRHDVVAMIDEIVDRGARRQAHMMLGHTRTIFNWAINRGVYGLEQSPCDRLRPSALIGRRVPRDKVLTDDEIRAVWHATETLGYPYGPLVRLLMLTGQREFDVANAKRSEFDLSNNLWNIPGERFKSEAPQRVPLTDDSTALLAGLPKGTSGDFLFSFCGGKRPVNGFSKAKRSLDLLLAELVGHVDHWVFHDIRRTVRTRLSALRVEERVAELVIGHARKGLVRIYDQHQYIDEMREALALWGRVAPRNCGD